MDRRREIKSKTATPSWWRVLYSRDGASIARRRAPSTVRHGHIRAWTITRTIAGRRRGRSITAASRTLPRSPTLIAAALAWPPTLVAATLTLAWPLTLRSTLTLPRSLALAHAWARTLLGTLTITITAGLSLDTCGQSQGQGGRQGDTRYI